MCANSISMSIQHIKGAGSSNVILFGRERQAEEKGWCVAVVVQMMTRSHDSIIKPETKENVPKERKTERIEKRKESMKE